MNAPQFSLKPRFTLVIGHGVTGESQIMFYTLAGLEQWLDNARAMGEVKELDKISIYDDSGVKL